MIIGRYDGLALKDCYFKMKYTIIVAHICCLTIVAVEDFVRKCFGENIDYGCSVSDAIQLGYHRVILLLVDL